jgi:hypothetical protein
VRVFSDLKIGRNNEKDWFASIHVSRILNFILELKKEERLIVSPRWGFCHVFSIGDVYKDADPLGLVYAACKLKISSR